MPAFMTEEELTLCSSSVVAAKADEFINQILDNAEAEMDAYTITAEQNCVIAEQKFLAVSDELSSLYAADSDVTSSMAQSNSELQALQKEKNRFSIEISERDFKINMLKREALEFEKCKNQLKEILKQKDSEISEKTASVTQYLNKIVKLAETLASKESQLEAQESEISILKSICSRYVQEKEISVRHNQWLDAELTRSVTKFLDFRRESGDTISELSSKVIEVEKDLKVE